MKTAKITRIVPGTAAVAVIGYGLLELPTQLGAPQLPGLLLWLAVAVLLHDGVIVPVANLLWFWAALAAVVTVLVYVLERVGSGDGESR